MIYIYIYIVLFVVAGIYDMKQTLSPTIGLEHNPISLTTISSSDAILDDDVS